MRRFVWAAVAFICLVLATGSGPAVAASLHQIGKFKQPIYVTSSPTDSDRLLVAEREGTIVEVTPQGTRQLADLSALITCCESERGLLSIAPAPDFANSGRFYAAYTGVPAAGGAEGDVHLDSFRPDPATGALIREPILSVGHSSEANHNGGQLQFGPDGHLYFSLGDGGGGVIPPATPRTPTCCSARSSASTRGLARPRPTQSRLAIHSHRAAADPRFGTTGCVIRGASPSTARRTTC